MSNTSPKPARFTINNKPLEWDRSSENDVTVTDRGGCFIQYRVYEGVHYPRQFNIACIQQIRGFKLRPDDIYFTGYLRTGTHWTYERMAMLIKGKAETIPNLKEHLEILPESYFDDVPSPRVLNSHMYMSKSPEDLLTKKCKVVYTMRDPKDVIVSMYHLRYGRGDVGKQYLGNFGDFLHLFLSGNVDNNGIFEHCRDAERYFENHPEIPVYITIYEDSQKDPVKTVQELSDFLGLPRDDDLCTTIAEKCEFSKMKVDKDAYSMKLNGKNFLYRKGAVGDWKNWFTDELLDEYYKVYEEKMAGSRFYHRYSRSATNSQ